MKKFLSLVVLGAMAVASCGGSSGAVAATVDGTEVNVDDVNSLVQTEGTVPVSDFAQFLAFAIQRAIVVDAAEEDYGVTVTDDEVEEEATRLYEELSSEGQSREDFLAAQGFTDQLLTRVAEQNLIDTQVRDVLSEDVEEPTAEEIDQARADAVVAQTEACVSHILVETEEEANDVLTRLEDGEAFADVATEVSIDTQSGQAGGELGCGPASDYVDVFRDAVLNGPVGEVNPEPVESQFGFHVVRVSELTEPTLDDLPTDEDLAATVVEDTVVTMAEEWFFGTMEEADVTVAEEYGTWSPVPPTVTPPSTGTTSGE